MVGEVQEWTATFDLAGGTQTCDTELIQTITDGGDAMPPSVMRYSNSNIYLE